MYYMVTYCNKWLSSVVLRYGCVLTIEPLDEGIDLFISCLLSHRGPRDRVIFTV